MTEDNNRQKPAKAFTAANFKLTAVAGQVGCVTLVIVFIALFLGIYLDRLLGTKPVLLIILVLGSAPIALYLTYKIAINAVREASALATKQKDDQQNTREET